MTQQSQRDSLLFPHSMEIQNPQKITKIRFVSLNLLPTQICSYLLPTIANLTLSSPTQDLISVFAFFHLTPHYPIVCFSRHWVFQVSYSLGCLGRFFQYFDEHCCESFWHFSQTSVLNAFNRTVESWVLCRV